MKLIREPLNRDYRLYAVETAETRKGGSDTFAQFPASLHRGFPFLHDSAKLHVPSVPFGTDTETGGAGF